MKKIILILQILLVFVGCEGLFRKDDELSFVKTPNTTDKIRLDGYYYIKSDGVGIDIYFQNGIVLFSGWLDSLESFEDQIKSGELVGSSKPQWGLYLIKEDSIYVNGLAILSGALYFSEMFSQGIILNDTTILFQETRFADGSIDYYNDTLHFKQFSLKPDSTNVFIK